MSGGPFVAMLGWGMTARLLLCLVLVAVASGAEEEARPGRDRSAKVQPAKTFSKKPAAKKPTVKKKAVPEKEKEKAKPEQVTKKNREKEPEKEKTPPKKDLAQEDEEEEGRSKDPLPSNNPRPGSIGKDQLREYTGLTGARKRIVDEALALAARPAWLKYRFGSAEPENGGLDCSGSVYYVFQSAGIQPPRTSAAQFSWVQKAGGFVTVPAGVTATTDAVFEALKPGDLLFWSGTYEPKDGREVDVSHVQIFLGHEKSDGLAVMIGASDGRTYRGTKRNGYGVFDFRLPREGSKAKFLGFGPPPGVTP